MRTTLDRRQTREQPMMGEKAFPWLGSAGFPVQPSWLAGQTLTPQEPWHSVCPPGKHTPQEPMSIFLKSQLDLPPGGESANSCASHIRLVNFLPISRCTRWRVKLTWALQAASLPKDGGRACVPAQDALRFTHLFLENQPWLRP